MAMQDCRFRFWRQGWHVADTVPEALDPVSAIFARLYAIVQDVSRAWGEARQRGEDDVRTCPRANACCGAGAQGQGGWVLLPELRALNCRGDAWL